MHDSSNCRLHRFVREQETDYACVLEELRNGRKDSHWMWYVFPQIMGLGQSSMAQEFAIVSRDEAVAYLDHPILGSRLIECCETLLTHRGTAISDIMGDPDDIKLRSSMTLFCSVSVDQPQFQEVLDVFYDGTRCDFTTRFLHS